jgi:hypothetical protein
MRKISGWIVQESTIILKIEATRLPFFFLIRLVYSSCSPNSSSQTIEKAYAKTRKAYYSVLRMNLYLRESIVISNFYLKFKSLVLVCAYYIHILFI